MTTTPTRSTTSAAVSTKVTLQMSFVPNAKFAVALRLLLQGYAEALQATPGILSAVPNTDDSEYTLTVASVEAWDPDQGEESLVRRWKALRMLCTCDIARHPL